MKVAIGQDSHRIDYDNTDKKLILAGVEFEEPYSLSANSDGDVVMHAVTNAVSGITCQNILGKIADDMCLNQGITDSEEYLKEALKYLDEKIAHLSISIECKVPKIGPKVDEMRKNLARILNIDAKSIGITATTGEGLTEFGKGNGISVFACLTVE
ncbi:MAG: 2-C-methyl-D-erythritol 2,4-cyclodiphosphate synthase [Eubacteriales bacterium]|nr:2-C-methyl-D-erythritol 2,4-cyclodiphosphate synthase [Eubacteriales bacterium]